MQFDIAINHDHVNNKQPPKTQRHINLQRLPRPPTEVSPPSTSSGSLLHNTSNSLKQLLLASHLSLQLQQPPLPSPSTDHAGNVTSIPSGRLSSRIVLAHGQDKPRSSNLSETGLAYAGKPRLRWCGVVVQRREVLRDGCVHGLADWARCHDVCV